MWLALIASKTKKLLVDFGNAINKPTNFVVSKYLSKHLMCVREDDTRFVHTCDHHKTVHSARFGGFF